MKAIDEMARRGVKNVRLTARLLAERVLALENQMEQLRILCDITAETCGCRQERILQ